jgi:hypothetical protein
MSCTAVLVLLGFAWCYFLSSFHISELTASFSVSSWADYTCLLYICWLISWADSCCLLYTVWVVSWADFHCWFYHLCIVLYIFHCYVCLTVIKWHISMQCPLPASCELSHLPNCKIRILFWFFYVKNGSHLIMLHQVQYVLCRYYHVNWRVWVLCWWVLWGIGASVCFVLCHQHLLLAVCKICYKSKTDFIKKSCC